MKVIYPQETVNMLAECDEYLEKIRREYLRPIEEEKARWPSDPKSREAMLADPVYQDYFYGMVKRQQRALLTDTFYQAFLQQKAKIISLSPCTYQFDASELSPKTERQ